MIFKGVNKKLPAFICRRDCDEMAFHHIFREEANDLKTK